VVFVCLLARLCPLALCAPVLWSLPNVFVFYARCAPLRCFLIQFLLCFLVFLFVSLWVVCPWGRSCVCLFCLLFCPRLPAIAPCSFLVVCVVVVSLSVSRPMGLFCFPCVCFSCLRLLVPVSHLGTLACFLVQIVTLRFGFVLMYLMLLLYLMGFYMVCHCDVTQRCY